MTQPNYWTDKRIVVTGGAGFLGSHLVEKLYEAGAGIFIPRSAQYDLQTELGTRAMFERAGHIDVLFHLAATVGGIGANMRYPADFLYQNTIMNSLVVEYARRFEVAKFVGVGSVCAYPKWVPTPFVEENLFEGYPEETNAPYGISKRVLLVHLQAARRQYGFQGIYLIPTNLYGPRDQFDLETSHVIPALIRKISEAKKAGQPLTVWGTGKASRDFLYVEDAADALMLAAQRYNGIEPVNLGSGEEVTILGLVNMLADIMEFDGEVVWDGSKPDGQPRRALNSGRAYREFNWAATTRLREGLKRTVEWWEGQCNSA